MFEDISKYKTNRAEENPQVIEGMTDISNCRKIFNSIEKDNIFPTY